MPASRPRAGVPAILGCTESGDRMSGSIIQELKRRNVFRVVIVYVVVSWLLMQIGDVMFPALLLPEWAPTLLVAFLILGFPLVVVFAWAFELTPDGMVRTADVPVESSVAGDTGRKINFMIIGILAVAVVFLLAKDALLPSDPEPQIIDISDRSIAVLPFKNLSASEENASFFAGGLHDELLTLLSRLEDLKVISRTSVERLDPDLSIPEIGELLGVATILEGQVQRAGDRLRINVQLIDTSKEGHLWANIYDSRLTAENVFDVQSNIARTIASALQVELSADDVETLQAVPTTNTEALEKYLLGMQVAKRATFEAYRQAETYLVEATTMDDSFVDAWAGLAKIRNGMFSTGVIEEERYIEDAGQAVEKALALDPRNALALSIRAFLQTKTGEIEGAEKSFRTAIEIEPHNSLVNENFGQWLRTMGRLEEARNVLKMALEYDPLSPDLLFEYGRTEMFLGNPERNIEIGERLLEIDPSSISGYVALLQANLWRGRLDQAWPWFIKAMEIDPGDYETIAHIALFHEELGMREIADRYLAKAESLKADAPVVIKCKAMLLAGRGQNNEAAALADHFLVAGFDDRWNSDQVLLRLLRDRAVDSGNTQEAVDRYRDRMPEIFAEVPQVNASNYFAAADIAFALKKNNEPDKATTLIEAALRWYEGNQPAGVYSYQSGTVIPELHAVAGDHDLAMTMILDAADSGVRWKWHWSVSNKNFDVIRDRPEFRQMLDRVDKDLAAQRERVLSIPYSGESDLRDKPAL